MSSACALVLAAVLSATASASPTRETGADLERDGTREHLTLEVTKPGAFRLSAGTAVVEGELPEVRGVTVLDLDSRDKHREVLVHGEERWRLFRQESTALREMPLTSGTPSVCANGILLCDVPAAPASPSASCPRAEQTWPLRLRGAEMASISAPASRPISGPSGGARPLEPSGP